MTQTRRILLAETIGALLAYITPSIAATTDLSVSVTGTSAAAPIISVTPTTAAPGGVITATVTNGPGNAADWLGVFAVESPNPTSAINPASWKYLTSDNTSTPSSGVTTGTVHLTVPTTAGQYNVRFFPNNAWTVTAVSPPFTAGTVVTVLQPVITISPPAPTISDKTPLGAIVASYTVAMNDGSPFTGTVDFGPPNFDSGGKFALLNGNIIVNPAGPGIGPNTADVVTDSITLAVTTTP